MFAAAHVTLIEAPTLANPLNRLWRTLSLVAFALGNTVFILRVILARTDTRF